MDFYGFCPRSFDKFISFMTTVRYSKAKRQRERECVFFFDNPESLLGKQLYKFPKKPKRDRFSMKSRLGCMDYFREGSYERKCP